MNIYDKQRRVVKRIAEKKIREYGVPGMKWGQQNVHTKLSQVKTLNTNPTKKVGYTDKESRGMRKATTLDYLRLKVGKRSVRNAKTELGKARLYKLKKEAGRGAERLNKAANSMRNKRIGK
jgi:hypothetical protein